MPTSRQVKSSLLERVALPVWQSTRQLSLGMQAPDRPCKSDVNGKWMPEAGIHIEQQLPIWASAEAVSERCETPSTEQARETTNLRLNMLRTSSAAAGICSSISTSTAVCFYHNFVEQWRF